MEVTILHPCVYLNCYKKTNSAQRQTTYQWLPEWGRAGRRGHREEQRRPWTLGADGHFHSFYGINVFTGVYIHQILKLYTLNMCSLLCVDFPL